MTETGTYGETEGCLFRQVDLYVRGLDELHALLAVVVVVVVVVVVGGDSD